MKGLTDVSAGHRLAELSPCPLQRAGIARWWKRVDSLLDVLSCLQQRGPKAGGGKEIGPGLGRAVLCIQVVSGELVTSQQEVKVEAEEVRGLDRPSGDSNVVAGRGWLVCCHSMGAKDTGHLSLSVGLLWAYTYSLIPFQARGAAKTYIPRFWGWGAQTQTGTCLQRRGKRGRPVTLFSESSWGPDGLARLPVPSLTLSNEGPTGEL